MECFGVKMTPNLFSDFAAEAARIVSLLRLFPTPTGRKKEELIDLF